LIDSRNTLQEEENEKIRDMENERKNSEGVLTLDVQHLSQVFI
jgi:hypothetical protein